MLAENLAIFMKDFGVSWSKGAYSFTGLLDSPTLTLVLGGVQDLSDNWTLTAITADVQTCALTTGDSITANGIAFSVRDVLMIDDGAITSVTLQK